MCVRVRALWIIVVIVGPVSVIVAIARLPTLASELNCLCLTAGINDDILPNHTVYYSTDIEKCI